MFPHEFKIYFFDVLANLKKNKAGDIVWPKSVRKPFFLPCGNPNSVPNMKDEVEAGFTKHMKRGVIWEWAFKRDDTEAIRANIMLLDDEVKNCTFEPDAGF